MTSSTPTVGDQVVLIHVPGHPTGTVTLIDDDGAAHVAIVDGPTFPVAPSDLAAPGDPLPPPPVTARATPAGLADPGDIRPARPRARRNRG